MADGHLRVVPLEGSDYLVQDVELALVAPMRNPAAIHLDELSPSPARASRGRLDHVADRRMLPASC